MPETLHSSTGRSTSATAVASVLGVALALGAGWAALEIGGHTDAAGRVGLTLGAATLVLVIVGYRRGLRGWVQGMMAATAVGGALLAHFWSRLSHLP